MKLLSLFAVVCFLYQCASDPGDGLVFTHILFRHGERNILTPYGPNDPFADVKTYWPEGYGQLTSEGRRQQYELGEYLAKRYKNLIGENGYHKNNIYVRSTDVDRTLMSAAHTLAGMFPPLGKQAWNKDLGRKWQAIPIHTVPEVDDYVLYTIRPCPKYKTSYKAIFDTPEVEAVDREHAGLFKELTKFTGNPITKMSQIHLLYQTLEIEKSKGLNISQWAKNLVYKGSAMEKLINRKFGFYAKTKEMAKMRPGYLLKEILERFSKKANKTLDPDRSMYIYSAHDTTIAHVLNALNLYSKIWEPHSPPYSACVFFELHRNKGKYHIEIYYKSEQGRDKKPLQPLKLLCGTKCPLDEFYRLYSDIIPTRDYDIECKLN
ncbi:lysosomal acid phosphatase-like [Contarinia nasturtii]|uniref:lysosomal acid phosphatase-like n=1 Tax=Contarinia nasturtii TaxID=265458 RepID=UPI0012D43247|nr:lysosomal acid phosphatase-like [Contarinia nasturtii]